MKNVKLFWTAVYTLVCRI